MKRAFLIGLILTHSQMSFAETQKNVADCLATVYRIQTGTGILAQKTEDLELKGIQLAHRPGMGPGMVVAHPRFRMGDFEIEVRLAARAAPGAVGILSQNARVILHHQSGIGPFPKSVITQSFETSHLIELDPRLGATCRFKDKDVSACTRALMAYPATETILLNNGNISAYDAVHKGIIPEGTVTSFGVTCFYFFEKPSTNPSQP